MFFSFLKMHICCRKRQRPLKCQEYPVFAAKHLKAIFQRGTHTYRGPASASVRLLIQSPASGGHHTGGPGNILTSSSPLLEVTTGSWEKYPPLGLQLGLDTATRARWLGCEHPKATKPDISTQGNFTLIRDRSDGW